MTTPKKKKKRRDRASLYDPHRHRGGRCVALSPNGERCHKASHMRGAYHGNDLHKDIDGTGTSWVLVELCDEHARPVWNTR